MIYLNPYGKVTDCVSLKGNSTNAEKKNNRLDFDVLL